MRNIVSRVKSGVSKHYRRVCIGVLFTVPVAANAAVPQSITDMLTALETDATTVVNAGVAILVAIFGTLWLMGLVKKAANKAT